MRSSDVRMITVIATIVECYCVSGTWLNILCAISFLILSMSLESMCPMDDKKLRLRVVC